MLSRSPLTFVHPHWFGTAYSSERRSDLCTLVRLLLDTFFSQTPTRLNQNEVCSFTDEQVSPTLCRFHAPQRHVTRNYITLRSSSGSPRTCVSVCYVLKTATDEKRSMPKERKRNSREGGIVPPLIKVNRWK